MDGRKWIVCLFVCFSVSLEKICRRKVDVPYLEPPAALLNVHSLYSELRPVCSSIQSVGRYSIDGRKWNVCLFVYFSVSLEKFVEGKWMSHV